MIALFSIKFIAPPSRKNWWPKVGAATDIYAHKEREAEQSINFVTCHDGFTLNDLVSYDRKHNEANGENNRDGSDYNLSWNCGVEGPTDDATVEALRNRQAKNFFALELLSAGTPTPLMGDEARRTRRATTNHTVRTLISAGSIGVLERHADMHQFVKELNRFRRRGGNGAPSLNELRPASRRATKNSRRWRDAPIDKKCNPDRRIVVVCCPELERVRPVIVRGSTARPAQVHQ